MSKRYVETGVGDHVLGIFCEPEEANGGFDGAWVEIIQFEGTCRHGKYAPFSLRLRDAWRTLRGKGRPWEEFFTSEHVDALIDALTAARTEAFGPRTVGIAKWSSEGEG